MDARDTSISVLVKMMLDFRPIWAVSWRHSFFPVALIEYFQCRHRFLLRYMVYVMGIIKKSEGVEVGSC